MTKTFNINDYGAIANTGEVQTEAFQRCINACHANGGGEVIVPTGSYIIGSIQLFSNISLILQNRVHLIASLDLKDYNDFGLQSTIAYYSDPYYINLWNLPKNYFQGLIVAYNAENISIVGSEDCIIDGRNLKNPEGEEKFRGPMTIVMSKVNHLTLSGYQVKNAANWSHCLDSCRDIDISQIEIIAGHDGFNLHHSQSIKIFNCRLITGDDCLAGYDIHNLLVDSCYLNTACNVARVGGTNIKIIHSQITGPGKYPHLSTGTFTTHSLFKYYAIDDDAQQTTSNQISFIDCRVNQLMRLVDYQYKMTTMQAGPELNQLNFVGGSISDIQKTSLFKGNGKKVILRFENMTFDTNIPFLLEIDQGVTVVFENCKFNKPTSIQLVNDKKYELFGEISKIF